MRNLLLPVFWLGLAGPVCAQPPAAAAPATPAQPAAHAPRSPIGAAMANLSQALHDAAEQARRPDAPAIPDAGATRPEPASDASQADARRPQPTAQAALP